MDSHLIAEERRPGVELATVLDIDNVTAGYGAVTILRDVNLAVHAGEIVALLGPNGAGKTTTLMACSGFVNVTGGDIRFDGRSVLGRSVHNVAKTGLAHVPEDRALWPTLTIDEHLRLTSVPGALDAYDVFPALARMKDKRAGLLSGGEQQMLVMARALVSSPKLLLVDEMSMGLAPVIVEKLFETLQLVAREKGIGILLVEQHVHVALRYADRGYVMTGGRISTSGTAEDLSSRWSEIQASYLGK